MEKMTQYGEFGCIFSHNYAFKISHFLHVYTGCAKKKKDILNIHIKSEGIYIFFTKNLLYRVYHICGQMSKVHIYSPIIYDIALFQTLKRNYTVNGHEMYFT